MDVDAKLQQYLLLGKAAKGRGVAELIAKATAEPGLFTFGELLDLPSVQEVCSLPRERAHPMRLHCRPTAPLVQHLRASFRSWAPATWHRIVHCWSCFAMGPGQTTRVCATRLQGTASFAHRLTLGPPWDDPCQP